MALKRPPRSVSPDGDESGGEGEGASPLKRPRMENGFSLSRSATPDPAEDETQPDSLPAEESDSDAAMDEDEEESDEEEEEEDREGQMKAYQALHRDRATQNRVTAVKEAGFLKRIQLIDFMCHRNFTFEFAPKMNGIVGHNGSGKSAILTAIAIALGGKAAATGRGHMKDLIRNGADKAVVTLVLANRGSEALDPEKYGNEIIIERHITKAGASYKVKSSVDGKIIGQNRESVTTVTSFFQITVDSPLTILTQDAARGFLQSADEHTLYMLFTEGTGLQSLAEEYGRIRGQIEYLLGQEAKGRESLPETREVIEKCKRQLDSSKKLKEQKAKVRYLKAEAAWAYVRETEAVLEKELEQKRGFEEKIEGYNQNYQQGQKELVKTDAKVQELKNEVDALTEGRKPKEKELAKLKQKIAAEQKSLQSFESDMVGLEEMKRDQQRKIVAQQAKIDKKISSMKDGGPGAQRIKDQEALTKFDNDLRKAPYQDAKLKDDLEKAVNAKQEVQKELDDAMDRVEEAEKIVNDSKGNLQLMENNQKDRLAAFGTNVRAVLNEIDRTQWRGPKPVGPLGLYVRLDDMRWRDVLQRVYGQLLCSFACQHPADSAKLVHLLQSCAQRHGYRLPGNLFPKQVITNSGDMFDFSHGDRSSLGTTVLSQLRFEGEHAEYVKRVLVNRKIEATFLAPNATAADAEVLRVFSIIRMPVMVLSQDGFQAEGTPEGTTNYPITAQWRFPPIFVRDYASDIDAVKLRIKQEVADVLRAKATVQDIKARITAADQPIKKVEDETKKFKLAVRFAEQKREEIQARLNKEPVDELSAFEDVKREMERALGDYENQGKALEEEQAALHERINGFKAESRRVSEELREMDPKREKAKDDVLQYTNIHANLVSEAAHWQKSTAKAERELAQVNVNIRGIEQQAETFKRQASELHEERIQTRRKPDRIMQERNSMKKAIEDAEKTQGFNYEEVQREMNRAILRHQIAEKSIKELGSLARVAKQALRVREGWWKDQRRSNSIYVQCGFANFLSKRNMEGVMDMDHQVEKMYLRIRSSATAEETQDDPDGSTQVRRLWKTPKQLSGGERSFCTVSLLLALWDCIDSPLCCLDEWDVFLDSVNRTIAGNMLLECARDGSEKQYILITPQDMAGLKFGDRPMNKAEKMPDPERGQTTLPFRPAAVAA